MIRRRLAAAATMLLLGAGIAEAQQTPPAPAAGTPGVRQVLSQAQTAGDRRTLGSILGDIGTIAGPSRAEAQTLPTEANRAPAPAAAPSTSGAAPTVAASPAPAPAEPQVTAAGPAPATTTTASAPPAPRDSAPSPTVVSHVPVDARDGSTPSVGGLVATAAKPVAPSTSVTTSGRPIRIVRVAGPMCTPVR
ncbi:MAG: hypothetical protein JSS20_01620 [Proteobacteria bacterium]|nr:hypothetical protein [Pseudomonadota bacterium]